MKKNADIDFILAQTPSKEDSNSPPLKDLYRGLKQGSILRLISQSPRIIREMIEIPKTEYERMKHQITKLRQLEKIDPDLIEQFRDSLEDVKEGRIRRVA